MIEEFTHKKYIFVTSTGSNVEWNFGRARDYAAARRPVFRKIDYDVYQFQWKVKLVEE
jgi:hypothetical protein